MPCSDGLALERMDEERRLQSLRKDRNDLSSQLQSEKTINEALLKRCDEFARMLCWACGTILTQPLGMNVIRENKDLQQWWVNHQAYDFKRVYERIGTENKFRGLTEKQIVAQLIADAEKVHPVSDYHKGAWFPNVVREWIKANTI